MLKSCGWGGVVAHVIIVSALGPHFRLGLRLGPGLDNIVSSRTLFTGQTDKRTKISIYWAPDGAKNLKSKCIVTSIFPNCRKTSAQGPMIGIIGIERRMVLTSIKRPMTLEAL